MCPPVHGGLSLPSWCHDCAKAKLESLQCWKFVVQGWRGLQGACTCLAFALAQTHPVPCKVVCLAEGSRGLLPLPCSPTPCMQCAWACHATVGSAGWATVCACRHLLRVLCCSSCSWLGLFQGHAPTYTLPVCASSHAATCHAAAAAAGWALPRGPSPASSAEQGTLAAWTRRRPVSTVGRPAATSDRQADVGLFSGCNEHMAPSRSVTTSTSADKLGYSSRRTRNRGHSRSMVPPRLLACACRH